MKTTEKKRLICRKRRRNQLILALVALLPLVVPSLAHPQTREDPITESQLRAAIIVGILRFTQLNPGGADNPNSNQLTVCTLGEAPSARGFENEQPIRIRQQELHLEYAVPTEELASCPVIIVGDEAESTQLGFLNPQAFLICDTCDTSLITTAINLVRVGNRIRFDVDLNQARMAGVSFSADMLAHAQRVEGL